MPIDKLEIANMNIHYFRYPFSYFLEKQESAGFSSLVFWGSVPHIWVDQYGCEDTAALQEAMAMHDIKLLAYAARPYNYSLFSQKGSLQRKHTESYYRFCIDIARKLAADRICIDLWGALRDADYVMQYENCVELLSDLCAYADERNCTVVVGNVPRSNSALINTLDEVLRLKEDIDVKNCEVALDVCTALNNGEDIEDWLNTLSDDLSMIYIADGRNTGTGYPLGYGCYPVSKILRRLKERDYRGTVALKMDRERNELAPACTDDINITYLRKVLSSVRAEPPRV